jgi:hypothetical protein
VPYLEDDNGTATVFAEHSAHGVLFHEGRYATRQTSIPWVGNAALAPFEQRGQLRECFLPAELVVDRRHARRQPIVHGEDVGAAAVCIGERPRQLTRVLDRPVMRARRNVA